MRSLTAFALVSSILLAAAPARATECDSSQPEWLFCEDFEQGNLGWDAWYAQSPFIECNGCPDGTNDPDRIRLDGDAANAYDGDWSLFMPAAAAAGYRGASLTFRSCAGEMRSGCTPLVGYDTLYYRAWVKLASDHAYVHHFMSIGGTRPSNYWDGDGNAGCRPNGYRAAGTTLDFSRSHELFFYTYFPEMHCDDLTAGGGYCADMQPRICNECAAKEMPCENGQECCWGNAFSADPRPVLPRGEWVCLEMMMSINTPGAADGEMAFWVNDVLGHQQTGMQWRDVTELQLNKIWVQHYIASGDADQSNRIWWDNVIVSTTRIGCGGAPPDAGVGVDATIGSDATTGADVSSGGDAAARDTWSVPDTLVLPDVPPPDAAPGTGTDAGAGDASVAEGCACAQAARFSSIAGAALLSLVWLRRRRRRRQGR